MQTRLQLRIEGEAIQLSQHLAPAFLGVGAARRASRMSPGSGPLAPKAWATPCGLGRPGLCRRARESGITGWIVGRRHQSTTRFPPRPCPAMGPAMSTSIAMPPRRRTAAQDAPKRRVLARRTRLGGAGLGGHLTGAPCQRGMLPPELSYNIGSLQIPLDGASCLVADLGIWGRLNARSRRRLLGSRSRSSGTRRLGYLAVVLDTWPIIASGKPC